MMDRSVAPVVREITQERISAYAEASGDHNPIHIDEAYGRTTPFGGTIAHGMLVLALIGEMMQRAHGDAWAETGRLKVRFKAPTRPGSTVTASARHVRDADGAAEYEVTCVVGGEAVIEGRASVGVPRG